MVVEWDVAVHSDATRDPHISLTYCSRMPLVCPFAPQRLTVTSPGSSSEVLGLAAFRIERGEGPDQFMQSARNLLLTTFDPSNMYSRRTAGGRHLALKPGASNLEV
jgi:hypothetical protein